MGCFRKFIFLSLLTACLFLFSQRRTFAQADLSPEGQRFLQPQALRACGLYELKQNEPNLNGSGLNIAVVCRSFTYKDGEPQNDYQPDVTHNCLKNARITFYDLGDPPAGTSAHSTAICSILFGRDPSAYNTEIGDFSYEGIVPEANAHVFEFWHFLTDNIFPQIPPDCNIITASIGSNTADWWTRGIEAMAEQYGVTIVAGIGNGLSAYDLLLYPAAGANAIGVGVVDCVNTADVSLQLSQFSRAQPEHSSFGPARDGRCKPDIVAPGNCLAGGSEPDLYEPTGNYTSFATPIVAGAASLLMQKAKEQPALSGALSPQGGNCVIKAILMNSATKLAFWHKGKVEKDDDHTVPLDYIQGAGMLNAQAAFELLTAGKAEPGAVATAGWNLNRVDAGENLQNVYYLNIPDAEGKILTATLTWNRHYSQIYPFEPLPEKDVDLRLEIKAVNPEQPQEDILIDYSDSAIDNVEHIYCRLDPNYSDYEIIVTVKNGKTDDISTEPYAIAWNVTEEPVDDDIFLYDLDTNGIVNEDDTMVLFDSWIKTILNPGFYFTGDINCDCVFDEKDIEAITEQSGRKADWLNTEASNPLPAPEKAELIS